MLQHNIGLGDFRVRSPLLTESKQLFLPLISPRTSRLKMSEKSCVCFFLFLWLLRCFTSPGLPLAPMNSVQDNAILLALGSPIRTFPGQRLLGTSPRLFAPCTVLHRLLVSRHPPYALQVRTTKTHNCAFTTQRAYKPLCGCVVYSIKESNTQRYSDAHRLIRHHYRLCNVLHRLIQHHYVYVV